MSFHEYYEELINLKVDNMLTPHQEAELDAHLAECPECRERLDMYQMISNLSDDLLEDPPENFTAGVMYKVGLEKKQYSFKKLISKRIFTIAGAAAAIAILIYSGAFRSFISQDGLTAQSKIAADSVAEYGSPAAENFALSGAGLDESKAEAEEPKTMAALPEAQSLAPSNDTASDTGGDANASSDGKSDSSRFFGFSETEQSQDNRFDPATVNIGDIVAGLEVTDTNADYSESAKDVTVSFAGDVTLSGTLYFDSNENGRWGKFMYFYIDDNSSELLPYPIDDDRQIWFGIDNYSDAIDLLDIQPEDEGRTIAYKAILVIDSYTVVQNSSEGCNYASLKNIITLERISD